MFALHDEIINYRNFNHYYGYDLWKLLDEFDCCFELTF